MTALGTFYGVGLGPGDPGLVTLNGLKALQTARHIFTVAGSHTGRSVSRDIVTELPGITAVLHDLPFPMTAEKTQWTETCSRNAETIAAHLRDGEDCAFGTIGDCSSYSTCTYLLDELKHILPELHAVLIPGVNSWSALAAKAQLPLASNQEILRVVPAHSPDQPAPEFPQGTTTVLLKTYHTRNQLLAQLPPEAQIAYGENLGLPQEYVSTNPDEILSRPEAYLSMLLVKRPNDHD